MFLFENVVSSAQGTTGPHDISEIATKVDVRKSLPPFFQKLWVDIDSLFTPWQVQDATVVQEEALASLPASVSMPRKMHF